MKAFVVFASGVLLASPALAQSTNGGASASADLGGGSQDVSAGTASNGRAVAGERRICHRIETASGSRMNFRKVCRTAAEWRQAQRDR